MFHQQTKVNVSQSTGASSRLLLALLVAAAALLTVPDLARAANDNQGFIYGKITAESGTVYQGRLRWDDEEAAWGDLFNSTKEERPYYDEIPGRARRRGRDRGSIRIFGITIGGNWGGDGRSFVARFGDMKKIEIDRRDDAEITMKSGERYQVSGGSNDVGGKIYVWDPETGEVALKWDRIRTIEFLPTPADLEVPVFRLHGKMKIQDGEFEGFIQWDQQECLSIDKLDGEGPDGDMSIEMGSIRTIERRSRRSSRVVLKSGREFTLEGTNDVDDDNRGIYVEDPRYGRVLVRWDAFERLDFSDPAGSGPAYDDFKPGKPLRGKVTDRDGKVRSGRIIFDVDEAETWELLNGEHRDIEYSIPFSLVKAVIPHGDDSSTVVLKDGKEIELEDQADVGDGNAGILIFAAEGKVEAEGKGGDASPAYVSWDDVKRIDFDD